MSWALREEFPSTSQNRGWESESFSLYITCQSTVQGVRACGLGLACQLPPQVSHPNQGRREQLVGPRLLGEAWPQEGGAWALGEQGHKDALGHGATEFLRDHLAGKNRLREEA